MAARSAAVIAAHRRRPELFWRYMSWGVHWFDEIIRAPPHGGSDDVFAARCSDSGFVRRFDRRASPPPSPRIAPDWLCSMSADMNGGSLPDTAAPLWPVLTAFPASANGCTAFARPADKENGAPEGAPPCAPIGSAPNRSNWKSKSGRVGILPSEEPASAGSGGSARSHLKAGMPPAFVISRACAMPASRASGAA